MISKDKILTDLTAAELVEHTLDRIPPQVEDRFAQECDWSAFVGMTTIEFTGHYGGSLKKLILNTGMGAVDVMDPSNKWAHDMYELKQVCRALITWACSKEPWSATAGAWVVYGRIDPLKERVTLVRELMELPVPEKPVQDVFMLVR